MHSEDTTENTTEKHNHKLIEKAKEAIINALDENGNGKIDLEDLIIQGLKLPGIKINRDEFLQKQFLKLYPQEIIDTAIAQSPMKAHIPLQTINKIADETIKFERNCVSGIATALGIPGGWAMLATIPADIVQYYGYMLRAMQKLMYLYGFPQLDMENDNGRFDEETLNILIICFGVMNGVVGANAALKSLSKSLGYGVSKRLIKKPLGKKAIYRITQNILRWFDVNLTKKMFAEFFKKSIPVVGGVIGGTITYISFKPCCDKLKKSLQNTILSNPNYKPELNENIPDDIIEGEFTDVSETDTTEDEN